MEKRVLSGVEPERVMYYFEKISRIPRESGHEKQISDYIYQWAVEKGLEAQQDSALNVIIKKPASTGYEASDPVMLQAHMDMVCEKNRDSSHDFSRDPILLKIEGDMISSASGTTLGADNGIGVAYCMAVLEDRNLKHPPLEILLTTEEESTFKGALTASPEMFQARKLINLDQSVEDEILTGSCGGSGVKIKLPFTCEAVPKGREYRTFQLRISGLLGGHSGEDIEKGHGSAINLLVRCLYELNKKQDIHLCSISAGTSRLAISREAEAKFLIPQDQEQEALCIVEQMSTVFRTEYRGICDALEVQCRAISQAEPGAISGDSLDKLVQFLYVFPDGIRNMNGVMPGVVESSINLGILRFQNGYLEVEAELRGAFASTCQHIKNQLNVLCRIFGAEIQFFSEYAAWVYNPESELRQKAMEVFKREFGKQLKPIVIHAGIECGCLLQSMPWMDAVAVGPSCWGFHSPGERMSAASVNRVWGFLLKLLEELK
ncbi:beta-Ala-His dipeptidase [Aminipila luticellarii]|uniref:Cytosol non-specific dipeptidase n=1 Tax=Aminipila luticellarii TaxID=2507160 RepID=A0A410PYB0_9FIRM|nr:beta-Ala-His dipeptidase [Aminipila luticellarii]QAT43830.1 aminoacyl-histidine dipeptidase [Aminipila luticellarii]